MALWNKTFSFSAFLLCFVILTAIVNHLFSRSHVISNIANRIQHDSQLAQVTQSEGVKFTLNSSGLQSLSYNGQNFVSPPSADYMVAEAIFHAPDGTPKPYGWVANSLDTNLSVNSSTKSSGTNPDYFEQKYRDGKEDSFTVKMVWTAPDTKTAKADIYVTNNDPTDTLNRFSLEYFLGTGNTTSGFVTPNLVAGHSLWLMVGSNDLNASPVAFIPGDSWGSVAFFTDNYVNNSIFYDVWTLDGGARTSPVPYIFILRNYSTPGGAASNLKFDRILPGQTYHYALYIRFGTSSDTPTTLAPEALTSFRTSFPYLVNWPDRRPITRWFIGDGARNSATNPRSYLWDDTLDVFPLTPEKQAIFNTHLYALTDQIITRMNGMNPKPQGIVIWDLEGDEFEHYFTYVGYPNKLPDLAPEMDAAADGMFKKFTDAGYNVGLTLRPSDFQTGTFAAMPSSCTDGGANHDANDVYIATDGTYPFRGYSCTASSTWTNHGFVDQNRGRWPYFQHAPQDDATLLSNLESKVAYAHNRWGVKMFYVDSTVYSYNGGGSSMNFNIFRELSQRFPDCIFFPENESTVYFGASAPYNQTNPAVGGGVHNTSQTAKNIYPEAFSVLANFDGIDFADQPTYNRFVQSVKDGNIFMIDAWWDNPDNARILQIYRDAATTTDTTTPPTPTNPPATGGGGGSFTSTYSGGGGGGSSYIAPVLTAASTTTSSSTTAASATTTCKALIYPTITKNLTQALSGTDVILLQKILILEKFLPATFLLGTYDMYTTTAVSKFQAKYKIVTSGTPKTTGFGNVGPKTRNYINLLISQGKYPTLARCAASTSVPVTIIPIAPIKTTSKYFFARPLTLGSTGIDVKNLQIFLNQHGYIISTSGNGSPGMESTYFGPATKTALMRFQRTYANEILTPYGLTYPTGYFGTATMRKVNGMK